MADSFPYDVFLSHSAKDKAVVRPIAERLKKDGLHVWFDEWVLNPGDSIPAKIEDGLEQSRVLVLCMSANAFGSDWAQLEAGTFRFRDPLNKDRRFIPLRLDDTPIKGSLAQFLYINWQPAEREREYAKLFESLSARSANRPPRPLIAELKDGPGIVFADWEAFCQNSEGVEVVTRFVDCPPELPPELSRAKQKLSKFVYDEDKPQQSGRPFNGPRYYLRSVEPEIRSKGERSSCVLEFGPSDYRTFLVTNGMNQRWARKAGVSECWVGAREWGERWVVQRDGPGFFENSFGINVLVTALGPRRRRYALFCTRREGLASNPGITVGTADEGLRRRFGKKLFDESSTKNPAPNILKAAHRALKEEAGLHAGNTDLTKLRMLSVGRVRSLWQPGALFHLPLNVSVSEVQYHWEMAPDRKLEWGKLCAVEFSRDAIVEFAQEQETISPVATWAIVMAFYSLESANLNR